jgi:sialidase-1
MNGVAADVSPLHLNSRKSQSRLTSAATVEGFQARILLAILALALAPAGFAQTTIYWTGNGDRWGASPHTKWSLSPGSADYYQLQGGAAVHMNYDRTVLEGTWTSVLINRVNVSMHSVAMTGNALGEGFDLTLTDNTNNNTGVQLAGPITVQSGQHTWMRPAVANSNEAVFTFTGNSTWTVASNAFLLWAIPFTNNAFGITKEGAGTLALQGSQFYTGNTAINAGVFGVSGGPAALAGNLSFAAGARLLFNAHHTLTVAGQVTFAGFSMADLVGLDASVSPGAYTLMVGNVVTNDLGNVGWANAADLGDGKLAWFETTGGLQLHVAEDFLSAAQPILNWVGFDQGRAVLSLTGPTNLSYTIQESTNLAAWADAGSLWVATSPAFWTNPATDGGPHVFYRALIPLDPPGAATQPVPANLATGIVTTAQLSWSPGANADSRDVYFGPAGAMVFQGNQTATTFDPGVLSHNTTYQWRIDEKNMFGTTPGEVWSFTTHVRPAGVTYVGAGEAVSGTDVITPSLPSGLVPGDVLMLFVQTAGPRAYVVDVNGGTWLAVARGAASPQSVGTGSDEVHLTAYYSRYNGTQGAPTVSDSGDHQLAMILAFRGVVSSGVPWDAVDGNTRAENTTSAFAPGATTTVPNTLVVGAIATAQPAADGTNSFSGWNNSNGMVNLTERVDVSTSAGNGGALGIATANFAPAGVSYGRMNVTLAVPSYKAMLSAALKPEVAPGRITDAWPVSNATQIGHMAILRWTAGAGDITRDVYFGTNNPPPLAGSQSATEFDPGPLLPNTTYYWQVDEKNAVGTTHGVVRSFTTGAAGALPQLAGMTQSNALAQLADAGCAAGAITRAFSDTVPPGVIITQNPPAGTVLQPGMTVDMTRSRGPEAGVVVFPNGPDFLNGEAIPVHRCVSMVTTHAGTVLAFTEHRPNGKDDEDDMDVYLRRSTDGGETWGPVIVVAEDSMNPCKNQVPVVLPSGRILLLWLWNAWIPSEDDRTTREFMITYSDDDGLTWSPHVNITSQVYLSNWRWGGAGPGHGFVKTRAPHAGRIIFPCRHGVVGGQGTAHIIYSDDNGATFQIGGELTIGNESTACEQSDGDILFNARLSDVDYRYAGVSSDGGMTFPTQYYDTQLLAAGACQASLLEHSMNPVTGKANILFSNPDDKYERVNGTVKLSENDGDLGTWVRKFRYSDPAPAFSGYSDITVLNSEGDIGILWEFGSHYDKPRRWDGGVKFRAIQFQQITSPIP